MNERPNPESIHQARRAAIRNTLESAGMDHADAERWCDAWVLEATDRGLAHDGAYWT